MGRNPQVCYQNIEQNDPRSRRGLSRRKFLQFTKVGLVMTTLAPGVLSETVTSEPRSDSHELIDASATWLANAIRTKQVSSEEAVRAFLQHIEQVNPKLNAV